MNNVCMTMFSSTRGHHGNKEIYKYTIKDFENNYGLNFFDKKIFHIKVSENEEAIANEMEEFAKQYGFIVVKSQGNWKHFDHSHFWGYYQDMIKIFLSEDVQSCKYNFFMEDDWVIKSRISFNELFNISKNILKNKDILNVRLPHGLEEFKRIDGLSHFYNKNCKAEWVDDNYFIHNDQWATHPSFSRSRDLYFIFQLILRNQQHFMQYLEWSLSMAGRVFTMSELPQACFNSNLVNIIHIGEKDFDIKAII